ncbi:MAG: glycosyltransferase family 39 protein [Gammaproteobacteria bacterium]|jgi:4-amino-4-deoxy-L-arabinose transferase-like glycosyltransferase|nr:glycosyltransferase family 39 protein [Gammaproteobacteria bacterium]
MRVATEHGGHSRWDALPVLLAAAGAYLLAQLLVRSSVPGAVELDEAEQLLLSQWLQGGYSPQPPVYTWLQMLVFEVTGPGVLGLAALRSLLLLATFASTYLIARNELSDDRLAALAALSLLLISQVSWELQRENTHSLLVLTIAAAQFLSLQSLARRPGTAGYVVAGALAGLGLLAKYNYAVFLLATGLALLATAEGRRLLLDRRTLLAGVTAAAVLSPHLLWLQANLGAVSESLTDKLDAESATGPLLAVGRLGVTILSYLSPLWAVYLVLFPSAYRRLATGRPAVRTRFPFAVYFGIVLAVLVVLVAALDADRFRERWMHPLLFLFPVWFLSHVEPTPGRVRIFRAAAAAAAGLALAAMVFRTWVGPATGRYYRLNVPFERAAAEIRSTGLPTATLVANHYHLAGTLRLHFPDSRIYTFREDLVLPPPDGGEALLVWDATRSPEMPAVLRDYAERQATVGPAKALGEVRYVETAYAGAPGAVFRLGLARLQ